MLSEDEVRHWLEQQALNAPVQLGAESVRLNVTEQGAELLAILLPGYQSEQLQQALLLGFSGAIEFEAGLGLSEDGTSLTLAQWLPGVSGWPQASLPLEQLLNQLSAWRAQLMPLVAVPKLSSSERNEQRWRARLGAR